MERSKLSQILGHERQVDALRRAMATERMAHAYLFAGPEGCGKLTTACALAAALCCDVAPNEGCGRCESCRRIDQRLHPDLLILGSDGALDNIKVDAVRSLIGRLALPPHEARARVVVIDGADRITDQAANALLKTLEEPPRSTLFFLVTAAPERTLITLRSRCQRVSFGPLSTATIEELLRQHGIVDDEAICRAAPLAQGSAGRAFALIGNGEELTRRLELLRQTLDVVGRDDIASLAATAAQIASDRDSLARLLDDVLILLWRALTRTGSTPELETDIALDQALAAHNGRQPAGLTARWRALRAIQYAVAGNANTTLAAERALLALRQPSFGQGSW